MAGPKNRLDPDHIFNFLKVNKWFAISSILLFVSLGAMIMKDYNREWKQWQRKFRALEIEKTQQLTEEERQRLASDEEYLAAQKALQEAQQSFVDKEAQAFAIQKELEKLEDRHYALNSRVLMNKSLQDALRYELEEARAHHPKNIESVEKRFKRISQSIRKDSLELERISSQISNKKNALAEMKASEKEASDKANVLTFELNRLERKAKAIERSFVNDIFRDAPLLDFIDPSLRVKELIVNDARMDFNFVKVPRIDACTTCHIAIDKPGYEDQANPLKTHPNLELFLSSSSAHPIQDFGCTSCHLGLGGGLTFTRAAHTPANAEQQKEWEEKYDWHRMHHWEEPMLAKPHTEATCYGCHQADVEIKNAPKLNAGLRIMEERACFSCHKIEGWEGLKNRGPSLLHLEAKIPQETNWTYRWIREPRSFRPTTKMPQFWGLANSSDPESLKRNEVEIASVVHYLYSKTQPYEPQAMNLPQGDVERGKKTFGEVGCLGCHSINDYPTETPNDFGPELSTIGSKLSREWLADWLKNPNRYWPDTRMPSLRLSDQEISDVTEYLLSKKNPEFEELEVPALNKKVLSDVVLEYLRKSMPSAEANLKLRKMGTNDRLHYLGEKIISRYGCYSCHTIAGFEDAKPIGVELTEEASKGLSKFDFGFVKVNHTVPDWLYTKIMNPRIFDQGKIKEPQDKLRMPNYHFTPEEGQKVLTALLGLRKYNIDESKRSSGDAEKVALGKGRRMILENNCKGCHIIEGTGGSVLAYYEDSSMGPPNLKGQGAKVKADWFYGFIENPSTVRPWLSIRMPSFAFDHAQINNLIEYFQGLDGIKPEVARPDPINRDPAHLAFGKKVFEELQCERCHKAVITPDTDISNAAPSFFLTKDRLRYNWIEPWLYDPQKLLPGTRMPNLFSYEGQDFYPDTRERIHAIRDYLYVYEEMNRAKARQK